MRLIDHRRVAYPQGFENVASAYRQLASTDAPGPACNLFIPYVERFGRTEAAGEKPDFSEVAAVGRWRLDACRPVGRGA
jgi:hypothetical protein